MSRSAAVRSGLALLAVALTALAVGGCRSGAEKSFRRAEILLASDKPQLAAQEYQRLIKAWPRSPLAPNALYKLAYLYRAPLGNPQEALRCYETLAQDYPHSSFADDALLWVAYLGSTQLKSLGLVRGAVGRLESEHADNPRTCARARVQLAIALLEAGNPEVKDVCAAILKLYPDQTRQCAQAQLILARATESLDKNSQAAVKQYEAVVSKYPDSTSAVEAKQRIGWIYYGVKQAEAGKKPPPAAAAPAKLISGVPAYAQGSGQDIQVLTLECMRALLRHRGVDTDLDTLMAVSGAAFQFVYDPTNRAMGSAVFAANPFETIASAYGFAAKQDSSDTPEEAMLGLCQALDRDHPAVVPYTPYGWVIVVGYDKGQSQFLYLRPGAGGNRAEGFDEFARHWKEAADQGGGALQPFYQFSLGPQRKKPDHAELVRGAAARGAALLQRSSVFGAPAGPAAYEALVADLQAHSSGVLRDDASNLAAWGVGPLSSLRRARQAAARFLAQASGAGVAYGRLDAKLSELQQAFPRVPPGAKAGTPQPEFATAAANSASLAREALELERAAADSLKSASAE